ncbi:MAG: archease [candidate division WOR-3 bacterium]|nr:archease [candidate division WOR-3 bacterium]
MKNSFNVYSTTADIGLKVCGSSLDEIFVNAALGYYSILNIPREHNTQSDKTIDLKAKQKETLLVDMLNELIYIYETEGFIGENASAELHCPKEYILHMHLKGYLCPMETGNPDVLVKAATYSNLAVKEMQDHWEANIIFDI